MFRLLVSCSAVMLLFSMSAFAQECDRSKRKEIAQRFSEKFEPALITLRDKSWLDSAKIKGAELLDLSHEIQRAIIEGQRPTFRSKFRDFVQGYHKYLQDNQSSLLWMISAFFPGYGQVAAMAVDATNALMPNYEMLPGLCEFIDPNWKYDPWSTSICGANEKLAGFFTAPQDVVKSKSICAAINSLKRN